MRLEGRLVPRHVSAAKRQTMISSLTVFKGQTATMTIPPGDPEIVSFAGEIRAALEEAGIQIVQTTALADAAPHAGISFDVGANRREFATALARAFVDAGLCSGPIAAS